MCQAVGGIFVEYRKFLLWWLRSSQHFDPTDVEEASLSFSHAINQAIYNLYV